MIMNAELQPSLRTAQTTRPLLPSDEHVNLTSGIYDRESPSRPRLKLGSDTKHIDETSLGIVDHLALAIETLLNNTEFGKVARWIIEALVL
jgi:hypothetical protein